MGPETSASGSASPAHRAISAASIELGTLSIGVSVADRTAARGRLTPSCRQSATAFFNSDLRISISGRLHAPDRAINETGDEQAIVGIEGQVIQALLEHGNHRLPAVCNPNDGACPGVQDMQHALRIELHRGRHVEPCSFHPHIAGIHIEAHHLLLKPARP